MRRSARTCSGNPKQRKAPYNTSRDGAVIACQMIFKALTDRGTDARGIRRPTRVAALCGLAEATHADLRRYATICRVQNVMRPYLESMS